MDNIINMFPNGNGNGNGEVVESPGDDKPGHQNPTVLQCLQTIDAIAKQILLVSEENPNFSFGIVVTMIAADRDKLVTNVVAGGFNDTRVRQPEGKS